MKIRWDNYEKSDDGGAEETTIEGKSVQLTYEHLRDEEGDILATFDVSKGIWVRLTDNKEFTDIAAGN